MPKYNNSFSSPKYIEETIVNDDGVVGYIRIKPSGILWKPKGERKYFSVPLERFTDWITAPKTKAGRTSS